MNSEGARSRVTTDSVIGFVIPIALFIELGSPILLATSPLLDEGIFLPLSLVALPVAIVLWLFRRPNTNTYPGAFAGLSVAFILYVSMLALLSTAIYDPRALLYGVQWATIFAWFPYFGTLNTQERFLAFIRGFVWGAAFNIFYYFLSGILEMATYGALQDAGRLSQNLVLVGQYQVLVYVPTLIAYSIPIIIIMRQCGVIAMNPIMYYSIILCAFSVIVFLAAREAVLVIMAFVFGNLIMRGGGYKFLGLAGLVSIAVLFVNLAAFEDALRGTDFRLFDKVANLSNEDSRLAGRDSMITDVSQIISQSPVFGSYLLPPNSGFISPHVRAPSAHNMYVDAIVWCGLIGGSILIVFCLYIFGLCALRIRDAMLQGGDYFGRSASLLVLIFLVISNNINVPMRQPLVNPVISFLIYLVLNWRVSEPTKR